MPHGQKTTAMLSAPGARALLGSSILARLPLAMFNIALLVHAQRLTGSFSVAGGVSAAYLLSSALSAPLLGRLVDRLGQTRVLIWGATSTAVVLVGDGLVPSSTPSLWLIVLAGAAGLSTPPLAACVRTLLPAIVGDPSRLPTLFAFESTLLELTFVFGPPVALGVGALWSTGAALCLSGLVMLAGTLAFAAQPVSRRWRSERAAQRLHGGALRSPAMQTLTLVLLAIGAGFGGIDIGVTAAARALGSTATAGPLLGLWGVGSLLGGIAATRLGGVARGPRSLSLLLSTLALAQGALVISTGSTLAIGAVIVLAGVPIAPAVSSIYEMVDSAAPVGTHTEAFSWLLTASLTGSALGAAVAGALAQKAGARGVFAFVGAVGALTVLVSTLRSRSLETTTGGQARPSEFAHRPEPVTPESQGRELVRRDELARPVARAAEAHAMD
jgi:MFS family permease